MDFESKFLESSGQFSGELYQKSIEGVNGNVVFSPISVLTALSFLMFGASGKTLNQMKSSLKYNEISNENLEKNFKKITESFEAGGLSVANKIYLKKNFTVNQKFKEIATKSFHSEVESINFGKNVEAADNINHWVESKTNNKIKNLIKADSLNDNTRLVLVNSIHFKADWVHPFNPARNFKSRFWLNDKETVEVEFMLQRDFFKFGAFKELEATALLLPYNNSNVNMMIILPSSKTGLSALESKLNEINFSDLSKKMMLNDIDLIVPKFQIEFDVDLEKPLKKIGMERMFSDFAEFENLVGSPEKLKVSQVVHKAFIEVNEKGTEAGAATAIGVEDYSLPRLFKVDKPFLFALVDESKLLFVGRKVQ